VGESERESPDRAEPPDPVGPTLGTVGAAGGATNTYGNEPWGKGVADSAYFMPFLIVYYCDTHTHTHRATQSSRKRGRNWLKRLKRDTGFQLPRQRGI